MAYNNNNNNNNNNYNNNNRNNNNYNNNRNNNNYNNNNNNRNNNYNNNNNNNSNNYNNSNNNWNNNNWNNNNNNNNNNNRNNNNNNNNRNNFNNNNRNNNYNNNNNTGNIYNNNNQPTYNQANPTNPTNPPNPPNQSNKWEQEYDPQQEKKKQKKNKKNKSSSSSSSSSSNHGSGSGPCGMPSSLGEVLSSFGWIGIISIIFGLISILLIIIGVSSGSITNREWVSSKDRAMQCGFFTQTICGDSFAALIPGAECEDDCCVLDLADTCDTGFICTDGVCVFCKNLKAGTFMFWLSFLPIFIIPVAIIGMFCNRTKGYVFVLYLLPIVFIIIGMIGYTAGLGRHQESDELTDNTIWACGDEERCCYYTGDGDNSPSPFGVSGVSLIIACITLLIAAILSFIVRRKYT